MALLKRSALLQSVCLLLLMCACSEVGRDQSGMKSAIENASRAFSAACVRGDTAAIGQLYTDSAYLMPPGRTIRGRDAIKRYFAPNPRRTVLAHQMKSESLAIEGDVAIDVGTWSITTQRDGDSVQSVSDRYLVAWRRGQDGQWRMEYDMWHRPAN